MYLSVHLLPPFKCGGQSAAPVVELTRDEPANEEQKFQGRQGHSPWLVFDELWREVERNT